MTVIAVQHRVRDYDAWRVGYDEHDTNRKEHGCTGDTVLRGANDGNEILVLTYWPSMKHAQEFAADPSLKEVMQRAGVISEPRIEFYEEAGL